MAQARCVSSTAADSGLEAMVHCAGKLREQDLRVFRDYFDVNIGTTDSFAGTVLLDNARFEFVFQCKAGEFLGRQRVVEIRYSPRNQ